MNFSPFADSLPPPKRILFLHGWSADGARKTAFLRSLGFAVLTPRLSHWSFRRAVQTAQDAFHLYQPDLVVGSSRGGAVALRVEIGTTPLVLLSPAWWAWRVRPEVRTKAVVIHSRNDNVVRFADSERLCKLNAGVRLVAAGRDHRLNDPQARAALKEAVAFFLGTAVGGIRLVMADSLSQPRCSRRPAQ